MTQQHQPLTSKVLFSNFIVKQECDDESDVSQIQLQLKQNTPQRIIQTINKHINVWGRKRVLRNIIGFYVQRKLQQNVHFSWQQINQILQNTQKIQTQAFQGQRVYLVLDIKNIAHISFKTLCTLQFPSCYILNIQALVWLDMPNIQNIDLSKNKIKQFKFIGKIYFPHLQYLDLSENALVLDLSHISRIGFDSNNIQKNIHLQLSTQSLNQISKIFYKFHSVNVINYISNAIQNQKWNQKIQKLMIDRG